ncbi:MAG: hypothetical protein ACR2GW_10995 [Pyrinomonadaceae bacterium]|jgi:hypothetical protein|nr:hypothetical protein [Acidobacteriota bacterium]
MERVLPFLVPILISLGLFVMVGWIVWVNSRRRQAEAKAAAETHGKLLEKFTSSQELVDFLHTDEGRRFLESAAGPRLSPLEGVLRFARYGVILTIFGLGWLSLNLLGRYDDDGAFTLIGVLLGAVGVGFLVSAAVSYYLSQKWGLLTAIGSSKLNTFAAKPGETV